MVRCGPCAGQFGKMAGYLIKGINLTKEFDLGKVKVNALQGVDIEIQKGEYLCIMGPSGSGKSTLMHILGCLDTPTSGEYYLEGISVTKMTDPELARIRNEKIGFIFQNFNLLPRLTAAQNVELPLFYAAVKPSDARKRVNQLLEKLGLGDRANHRPNELSGGECQRVAIARALINNPSIIFADEPTGNLDSRTGEEIMKIFDQLAKEKNTIVLVTHDQNVARHAQRIIFIRDGKITNA